MKKKLFMSLLLLGSVLAITAQPALPNKVSAKLPSVLNTNRVVMKSVLDQEFQAGSKWGQKKTVDRFWLVCSDRDNNTTYMDPEKRQRAPKPLGFGERVIIAQIEGDMALVYEDSRMEHFPAIPSYAKSRGWVPMNHLLLWTDCPADSRGVILKALIAINLNEVKQDQFEHGRLFKNPGGGSSERLNMDMKYYYIMKESIDGNKVLLCQQSRFQGNNLFGWVEKSSYTPWNQRTCLEPNWSPSYVENHKNQKAHLYISERLSDSEIAASWTYGTSNGADDRFTMYRMRPGMLRFPVLSQPINNAIKCTMFADRTGNVNTTADFSSTGNAVVEAERDNMRKMNFIFAVEATTEMAQYIPAVKSALSACKDLGEGVRVGLVLYRGAEEGQAGIEMIPLTSVGDARLASMLVEAKANGRLTGNERAVALTQAIETATDASKMGFKDSQSNMVLIIGNRGNASDDNTLEDPQMLKRLMKNNIQLMSVQVMRNESGSWARYFDQIGDLIEANIKGQYRAVAAEAQFKRLPGNEGYYFSSSREGFYFARECYGEMGKAMAPDKLNKHIKNGIKGFAASVDKKQDIYEKALDTDDFYPEFLKHVLGERGYSDWLKVKAISSYTGYVKEKGSDQNDYWHYILYLSRSELEDLIAKLKVTDEAAKMKSNDRTHYINAIKALIKAQLPDKTDKEIENMTADEMENAIYGLNVPTAAMRSKYSIKDMANSSVVSNMAYFETLDYFHKKFEKLRLLPNSGYKFTTEVNNVLYYWIPIEMLP